MQKVANKTTREDLYNEIWTDPVSKVSKKYGVSDTAIRKKCKAYNIPLPSNEYWGRLKAGRNPKKELLPAFNGDDTILFLNTYEHRSQSAKFYNSKIILFQHFSEERKVILEKVHNDLEVKVQLRKPHTLIEQHKLEMKERKKNKRANASIFYSSYNYRGNQLALDINFVSDEQIQRLYLFLDALFKAIEGVGGKVSVSERDGSFFTIDGEVIGFKVKEKQEQYKETVEKTTYTRLIPSGKLIFIISSGTINRYGGTEIRETSIRRLDSMIKSIFVDIIDRSYLIKEQRRITEENHQKWVKEQERLAEIKRLHDVELSNLMMLISESKRFEVAEKIRHYVDNVEKHLNDLCPELIAEKKAWIEWARKKADWLNPLISSEDNILGSPDKELKDI